MDSPTFSDDGGSYAPPCFLLEEEQIILSQPSLFLQDMAHETHKTNAPCFDRTTAPETLKTAVPRLGRTKAPKTLKMNDTAERKMKKQAIATKKKIETVPTSRNSKVAAKVKMSAPTDILNVEQKMTEDKESVHTADMEHCKQQKRAETAEAALDALNKYIVTILNADDTELKRLCREKSIRIYGKAATKHKYACALLENYTKK